MVTVAGCLEKGETMKKRKIMFAAVIVVFCLVIFVVTRQQTSRSILGTMKMYSVFQIPEVSLAQGNYSGKKLKNLSFQDKVQLFHILQKQEFIKKKKIQNIRRRILDCGIHRYCFAGTTTQKTFCTGPIIRTIKQDFSPGEP